MRDGSSDGVHNFSVPSIIINHDGRPQGEIVNEFDEMIKDGSALMKVAVQDRIEKIRKLFPGNER